MLRNAFHNFGERAYFYGLGFLAGEVAAHYGWRGTILLWAGFCAAWLVHALVELRRTDRVNDHFGEKRPGEIRSWADVPNWAWDDTDEAVAYWDTHDVANLFAHPWERAYWRWGNRFWIWRRHKTKSVGAALGALRRRRGR